MALKPHPLNDVAARITRLQERAPDGVTITSPLEADSGCWEACGDGWTILSADPSEFADLVEERLADPGSTGAR